MRKWFITNFTYINKEYLKIVVAETCGSTQTRSLLSTNKKTLFLQSDEVSVQYVL